MSIGHWWWVWPRFTRDLDVVVAVADDNAAEQLLVSLCGKGYRPQDRLDLAALLSVATEGQLDLARQAAQTIVDRGYARGRHLVAELADIIAEFKHLPKGTDDP